jgi:integrase
MPWYRRDGKIETPLTDKEFADGMNTGYFVEPRHRAYCVLLFYSAVRKWEGLRVMREQFVIDHVNIQFDVGKRLKGSERTSTLNLPLTAPYMAELKEAIEKTKPHTRVFPYCKKTAYNIVRRVWKYPHLFRLTRITNFFMDGWKIPDIQSWTGLSLSALNYYIGRVTVIEMGKSLAHRKEA